VNRRAFLTSLAVGLLATPLAAEAQEAEKTRRIGYLAIGSPSAPTRPMFEQALRDRGWIAGKNVVIEYRYAEDFSSLPALAADLVRLEPQLIVAMPTASARAAKDATSVIPIVMWAVADPIGEGLIASYARPGGNVTGFTGSLSFETYAKQLQLLAEAVPRARRIAFLWNPTNPAAVPGIKSIQGAARKLGIELQTVGVRSPEEFDAAFRAIAAARADALLIYRGIVPFSQLGRLADLSLKHRLPTMGSDDGYASSGGLMTYSVSQADSIRRVAAYVDKVLKGAKPADLPVEQPTKFELTINLKTARALGLTVPPPLLLRADQVVE